VKDEDRAPEVLNPEVLYEEMFVWGGLWAVMEGARSSSRGGGGGQGLNGGICCVNDEGRAPEVLDVEGGL